MFYLGSVSTYRYKLYAFDVPGQPVPAPRMTRYSAFSQVSSHRYYAYCDAVRAALLDAYPTDSLLSYTIARTKHPFDLTHKVRAAVAIVRYSLYFQVTRRGTCRHGDPDNIAKSLLDALFVDDRHVLPQCLGMTCGDPFPRAHVEVHII